ncbi:MAG: hypothetical protein D6757_00565 [Alphaproteobacteria bacterium]|nr:MAG: hypothetical protein D6757_00565 [Alphaproteobacteria bacterium]
MKRLINGILFLVLFSAAVGLYWLDQRIEGKRAAIAELESKILRERTAIRVLEAEWAYLSNPDVIEARAERYLDLRRPRPAQLLDDPGRIPMRRNPRLARDEGAADAASAFRSRAGPQPGEVRR